MQENVLEIVVRPVRSEEGMSGERHNIGGLVSQTWGYVFTGFLQAMAMSLVIEMKSHGEGIGRDHMYPSESSWRLCENTRKPRGEGGRQWKNNSPEKVLTIVRLAAVQMEKADR